MLSRFIFLILFSNTVFATTQEELKKELFDSYGEFCDTSCSACGTSEGLITLEQCKHSHQCKECLTKHIVSKIESAHLPECIQEGCHCKIGWGIVAKLLDKHPNREDLLSKFKELTLKDDPNFKCCPNDNITLAKSESGMWHQYCEGCQKTHCFQCGVPHSQGVSCLEACPEQYASVIKIYQELCKNDPNLEWRICPHCGTPAEKKDGCNEIRCGLNYHSNHARLERNLGCGRPFNWTRARVFNPNQCIEVGDSSPPESNHDDEYRQPQWLQQSQMSVIYTQEMVFDPAQLDFEQLMLLFNDRFSAWLDEKNIDTSLKAAKAYLALNTVWNAAFEAAYDAVLDAAYDIADESLNKEDIVADDAFMKVANLTDFYAVNHPTYSAVFTSVNATVYEDAYDAADNVIYGIEQNEQDFEVIGRIAYRASKRVAFIYMYEHLSDHLNLAFDSVGKAWRISKSKLSRVLAKLNKESGVQATVLRPYTHVLRERVDALPNKKLLDIW